MAKHDHTTKASRRGNLRALKRPRAIGAKASNGARSPRSPELLVVDRKVTALTRALAVAVKRKAVADAAYTKAMPRLPAILNAPYFGDDLIPNVTCREVDVFGRPIWAAGPGKGIAPRRIYHLESLQEHIARHSIPRHTTMGKNIHRLARVAAQYDEAKKAAARESQVVECADAIDHVLNEATTLAMASTQIKPRSVSDVLTMARAVALRSKAQTARGSGHRLPDPVDVSFVKAILRLDAAASPVKPGRNP